MAGKKYEKIQTEIGNNSTITGNAEVNGGLRIDGRFEGNINADWVVVGEKGHVVGDIKAQGVLVSGTIEGTVYGSEEVEIKATGRLAGDLHTQKLLVEDGGVLDGHSFMNGRTHSPESKPGPEPKKNAEK